MARVLLVEDNSPVRIAASCILQSAGHEVEIARDGGEAMLKLGTFRPDVVILDLMMPVINGWEFLESKARSPDVVGIPVIICSGWADTPQPIPEGQVVVTLWKPIDPEALLETIRVVLADISADSK
jgi:CheY-like chemotaxis protein